MTLLLLLTTDQSTELRSLMVQHALRVLNIIALLRLYILSSSLRIETIQALLTKYQEGIEPLYPGFQFTR